MSMISLVSFLPSKTKFSKIFRKSCLYYLCFYLSFLSPFLWHFSSEHSTQVYGTVRSLMMSSSPVGLSVHCTSPKHSLVPAAPSFPSSQDSMYFFAFLLTVCTLLSALLVFRLLTCLFFSLYSLNISCNFSLCILRIQKMIVPALSLRPVYRASCSASSLGCPVDSYV